MLLGLPHADDVERVLIDGTVVAQLAHPHAASSPHDQFVARSYASVSASTSPSKREINMTAQVRP
jgi:hypothetical protein